MWWGIQDHKELDISVLFLVIEMLHINGKGFLNEAANAQMIEVNKGFLLFFLTS